MSVGMLLVRVLRLSAEPVFGENFRSAARSPDEKVTAKVKSADPEREGPSSENLGPSELARYRIRTCSMSIS
jgi:hypothetical protein